MTLVPGVENGGEIAAGVVASVQNLATLILTQKP